MICIKDNGLFKVGDKVNRLRGNDIVSEVEFNGYKFWVNNINFKKE